MALAGVAFGCGGDEEGGEAQTGGGGAAGDSAGAPSSSGTGGGSSGMSGSPGEPESGGASPGGGSGGEAAGGTSGAHSGGSSGADTGGSSGSGRGGAAASATGGRAGAEAGGSAGSAAGGIAGTATGGSAGGGAGGSSGHGTGATAGIPECCGVDQPCPSGYSCQGTHGDLADSVGTCEPTPTDGGCWNDIDCPGSGLCTGQTFCACGVQCFAPPSPGTCEPMGEPCCLANEDCEDGVCLGASVFRKGRCAEAPTDGACYTTDDCASGVCSGGSACGCGANCVSTLGTCVTLSG